MSTTMDSLRGSFDRYRSATAEGQQEAQNQLLKQCGNWYQARWHRKTGLSDAWYLERAHRVLRHEIFPGNPGAQNRLKPSADRYIRKWETMCKDFSALTISSFVEAHIQFVNASIKEQRTTGKTTPSGITLNHPDTLENSYSAVMQFLIQHPDQYSQAAKKIAEREEDLCEVLFFSSALVAILTKKVPLPEFFQPLDVIMQGYRNDFGRLLPEDQSALLLQLQKKLCDHVPDEALSDNAQKLFNAIYETMHSLKSGKGRDVFWGISHRLFCMLDEDLALVNMLSEKNSLVGRPTSAKAVIELLRQLPETEYEQFRAVKTLMIPPKEELELRGSERREFYRVELIFQLAAQLIEKGE